jgi:hypothetical protein
MILREWQCVPPSRWTDAQLEAYCNETALALAIGMTPVVKVTSPLVAVNMLLAIVAKITLENQSDIPRVLEALASLAEAMESLPMQPSESIH